MSLIIPLIQFVEVTLSTSKAMGSDVKEVEAK